LNGAIADERGTTVGQWEPVQQGNRTGIRLNGSRIYWLTEDEREIINFDNNSIFMRAEN
jgi:allophanate hydrolase subunit 2